MSTLQRQNIANAYARADGYDGLNACPVVVRAYYLQRAERSIEESRKHDRERFRRDDELERGSAAPYPDSEG